MVTRICPYCENTFETNTTRVYCDSSHETPCDSCGEIFLPDRNKMRNNIRRCISCSRKNQSELIKNLASQGKVGFSNPKNQEAAQAAVLEKYGVPNVQQVPEIKDKAKNTMVERYGADNSFSSPELLEKIAKTNIERYGAANPFSSEEITKKRLNNS